MAAMADGTEHDLHGAQVGVATVVAAALWEVALDEVGLGALDPWALAPPDDLRDAGARVLDRARPERPARRRVLDSGRAQVRRRGPRDRSDTARFLGGWARARGDPAPLRLPAGDPGPGAAPLGGARCTSPTLTPAVDPQRARWALACLPFMRDRFTLADLLLLAGRWTDELVERVLDRAARAGGGL